MALDNAIKRFEDAKQADPSYSESASQTNEICSGTRFDSRADLEVAIGEMQQKVKDAISNKQFDKASNYQAELDELEDLRPTLPSIEELEKQLDGLKSDVDASIGQKNFKEAEILQQKVDELETILDREKHKVQALPPSSSQKKASQPTFTNEKGDVIFFDSRYALEQEITRYKTRVDSAASSKQFKNAKANQVLLDSLENLRSLLPTTQELMQDLSKVRADMEEAIHKKEFEEAEQLHERVAEIESQLELERKNSPKPTVISSTAPKIPTSLKVIPKVTNASSGASVADSTRSTSAKKITGVCNRPVSKLRPKSPIVSSSDSSVLAVVQMLANKRGDAAIITDEQGGLAGIITDTDVTRRLVAKNLSAASTNIASVMTSNPTCVSMSDPATDALVKMVENRFRHLPVTDDNGAVVGVIDIAKCLNDAIDKLERSAEKSSSAAEDAIKQMSSLQGAGGAQSALMQQLLGPLLTQAFGGKASPTLRSILAGKPSTIAPPSASLQEVGVMMAEARKAALVVENGKLVGIFGFKDMMSRAIAKELPLDLTPVSTVMTPNPESVSPDTTVLEALQIMHDNKFLTLPVCESNGSVIGVVDVMDCVYASGGAEGWRSIFASALECDDATDEGSTFSAHKTSKSKTSRKSKKDYRPVSKLRPKKPVLTSPTESILGLSQLLSTKRGDAALVVDHSGSLLGVITDTDVTRRLVAKQLSSSTTLASDIMTSNPTCVSMTDSAMDALVKMVENRFRHLPVTDDSGAVVGLLDIAKCLNDAIDKLERSAKKSKPATDDAAKLIASLQQVGGSHAAAIQMLLSQAFGGNNSPTLRSVLAGNPSTIVSPQSTLETVGLMMAEARKAALVVEGGNLVGIFGFKDMMSRAIAKDLALDTTPVSAVMTPDPESVSPETTVLEALQIMHDNRFLTLPVCEDDGSVIGLVDVMDCVYASGGTEGWKALFDTAFDQDDGSSVVSADDSVNRALPRVMVTSHPNNIPLHVEVGKKAPEDDGTSVGESLTQAHPATSTTGNCVAYKVVDESGHTYIIRAEKTIESIVSALEGKVAKLDPSTTFFKYSDEEGDEILIKSDECLKEAVCSSLHAGNKSVKLSMISMAKSTNSSAILAAGGVGLVAVICAMVFFKPKK